MRAATAAKKLNICAIILLVTIVSGYCYFCREKGEKRKRHSSHRRSPSSGSSEEDESSSTEETSTDTSSSGELGC